MTRPLPRFVNAFTAKGRRYYYFRRPGAKPIRLPDFGTPEFEIAYRAALQTEVPAPGSDQTLPGSVNAAIVSYYSSKASFQTLAPATQMLRRVYLEKFRERYGKNAIASMRPEFVAQTIDRMTPSSAHNWVKAIRGLMQHAIAIGCARPIRHRALSCRSSVAAFTLGPRKRSRNTRRAIQSAPKLGLRLSSRSVPRSGAMTSFVWVGSIFVMASYSSANPRPAPNF
jgi:hypothetical protein